MAPVRGRGRRRGQPCEPREVLRRHLGRPLPRARGRRCVDPAAAAGREPGRPCPGLLGVPRRLVLPLPRVTGTHGRRARPARRGVPATASKPRRPDRFVRRRRARPGSRGAAGCRRTPSSTGIGPVLVDGVGRHGEGRARHGRAGRGRSRRMPPDGPRSTATDGLANASPEVQRAAIALIGRARVWAGRSRRARRGGPAPGRGRVTASGRHGLACPSRRRVRVRPRRGPVRSTGRPVRRDHDRAGAPREAVAHRSGPGHRAPDLDRSPRGRRRLGARDRRTCGRPGARPGRRRPAPRRTGRRASSRLAAPSRQTRSGHPGPAGELPVRRLRSEGRYRSRPPGLGDRRAPRTGPSIVRPGSRRLPVRPRPRGRRGGQQAPSIPWGRCADPHRRLDRPDGARRAARVASACVAARSGGGHPAAGSRRAGRGPAALRPASAARRAPSCAMRSAVTSRSVRRPPGGWLPPASGRPDWTTRRWSSAIHGSVPMPGRLPGSGCGRGPGESSTGGYGLDIEPPAAPRRARGPAHGPDARRAVLDLLDRLVRTRRCSDGWPPSSPATARPGQPSAACAIASNVDWWSAAWGNRAFLEPFIDPVTTIGPHARALIGIALGAKEAGERGLATDVVRLALADGRLTRAAWPRG